MEDCPGDRLGLWPSVWPPRGAVPERSGLSRQPEGVQIAGFLLLLGRSGTCKAGVPMRLRSWVMILVGLVAMVISPFQGSWAALGLGFLMVVAGSGLLALWSWQERHPVKPTRLFESVRRTRRRRD